MSETLTICDRCGEVCSTVTDDALDFCSDCGVVEGNTHTEEVDIETAHHYIGVDKPIIDHSKDEGLSISINEALQQDGDYIPSDI